MGITRKKKKFLTSLAQNSGYKNKSKKKYKEEMVGGVGGEGEEGETVESLNKKLINAQQKAEAAENNFRQAKARVAIAEAAVAKAGADGDTEALKKAKLNLAGEKELLKTIQKAVTANAGMVDRKKKALEAEMKKVQEAAERPEAKAKKKLELAKAEAAEEKERAKAAKISSEADKLIKKVAAEKAEAKAAADKVKADKAKADKAEADKARAEKVAALQKQVESVKTMKKPVSLEMAQEGYDKALAEVKASKEKEVKNAAIDVAQAWITVLKEAKKEKAAAAIGDVEVINDDENINVEAELAELAKIRAEAEANEKEAKAAEAAAAKEAEAEAEEAAAEAAEAAEAKEKEEKEDVTTRNVAGKIYPSLSPFPSPVPRPPKKATNEPKQVSSETTIETTKLALLQSIELCIKVQNSNVKDEDEGHTIDNKIIVAINATLNSENYNFSSNTLSQAIAAITTKGSIIQSDVIYTGPEKHSNIDSFTSRATGYIEKKTTAVATAGTDAINALTEHKVLHNLVNSIVAILPYYKIDKKNAFSIIAIFTILAAKGHVKFASSIPLTIPALNSFMAALNAYEASLELQKINGDLKKQTGGGMSGGMTWGQAGKAASDLGAAMMAAPGVAASGLGAAARYPFKKNKAAANADAGAGAGPVPVVGVDAGADPGAKAVVGPDAGAGADLDAKVKAGPTADPEPEAPPYETDRIALQIAQVKAANNLALKAEHYFYTCVAVQEEAERSGTGDIKQKADSARFFAQKYYSNAKTYAEQVTSDALNIGGVNAKDLGILTTKNIEEKKGERETIDNNVKKIINGTASIEDKTTQLMKLLNNLLDNKRILYDVPNIQAAVTNAKTTEEQAHIASINIIMNYFIKKNVDLKYYWAEVVTSKYNKDLLRGKVGIINEIDANKTEADERGLWNLKLWVPDVGGEYITSPQGAVSTYMKVTTKDNKTINTFAKQDIVSIYSVRFLEGIKYDPNLPNNRQPDVTNANMSQLGNLNYKLGKGLFLASNSLPTVSGRTRGTINAASAIGSAVNKYTLGIGEFKSKYKIEIEKILDHEIVKEAEKKLLKTVIVYSNKKLSIRDILATNISSIFAKGETSLNVFRQQNLKKNFEKKKTDPEDEEGKGKPVAATGKDGGEQEEEDGEEEEEEKEKAKPLQNVAIGAPIYEYSQASTVKGKLKGGALEEEEEEEEEEQTGGLGGYGFRNFDRDDAKNFITFILTSLLELKNINSDSKLNNNQALLFEKYLRTLFGKVGPKTLNGLLPQIDNAIAVSGYVIKHFIIRLKNDNEGKQKPKDEGEGKGDKREEGEEGDGGDKGEEEATPAKLISQLNFSLKHNVGPFVAAIIDITLNTQELKGSEGEIENYLDRKFDLAMKKPQDKEQTRISNSELRDVFKSIFGPNMSTINIYRERITKMDELIDAINDKNINKKFTEINHLLVFAKIEKGVITYNMPTKIKAKLETQPTDETTEEKLARALALIEELKRANNIDEVKTKTQHFI
jgi:hypothetical protein